MIIIAACLYLPEHVTNVWSRAWFYYAGDETASVGAGGSKVGHCGVGPGVRPRMEGQQVFDTLRRL